jgi:hypothetical protein
MDMKLKFLGSIIFILSIVLNVTRVDASWEEAVLTDSKWVADVEIVFPPGEATLFVQNGKIDTDTASGDRYFPYCTIITNKNLRNALVIEKNSELRITKVYYRDESVNSTAYIFTTVMQITAPDHPEIASIECSFWGDQTDSYLSIFEMKKTLATVLSLQKK